MPSRNQSSRPRSSIVPASVGISSHDFFERVWELTRCIPSGRVTTYGHIASALGLRSSARMVGWALNSSGMSPDVPAHRVVNRLGQLSGRMHFETPTLMRELLEAEGIEFRNEAIDLERFLWIPDIDS